jgi:hypothetical protein
MSNEAQFGEQALSLRSSLLSPEEVAHNLGLSMATMADWRSQGRGPRYLRPVGASGIRKQRLKNGCNPKSGRQAMSLRNRNGIWNYRFKLDGKEYSGTTDLAATKQNMRAAQDRNRNTARSCGRAEDRHDRSRFGSSMRRLEAFSSGQRWNTEHIQIVIVGSPLVSQVRKSFLEGNR